MPEPTQTSLAYLEHERRPSYIDIALEHVDRPILAKAARIELQELREKAWKYDELAR